MGKAGKCGGGLSLKCEALGWSVSQSSYWLCERVCVWGGGGLRPSREPLVMS